MRRAFQENSSGITADATGLVAGLSIGDTDQISDSLKRKMKVVSLTHLTAVSGANCIIVLGFVFVIIRHTRANRWWRLVIGIAALIFYVLLVGAAPSVLRAAVMAGAVMLASVLGRKPDPLYALALAVLVLLIADPWLSIDYGFALSVAATAGILILGKPIVEKLSRYVPKPFAIAISIALAAQIICLPVLLQLQGGLSTYSVVANVAAESLVAPVTVLGILACCFAWWLPGVASMFYFMASLGTWIIAGIANYFALLPENQISWPTGILGVLLSIISIVAILLWLKTDSAQLKNIGKATLAIVIAATLGFFSTHVIKQLAWPNKNWQIVACDVGQGDAIVVRSENSIALVDVGREPEAVAKCLHDLDVKYIDLLVLSHFDMDHVGGLAGVLESQKVGNVLLSPFADQRWGATGTLKQLEKVHAKITYGEVGLNGSLGSARWRVLNPARAAVGSEDSNDASLAVWFEFKDFNFLTMADVGERGQMRMSESSVWLSEITQKPIVLKVSHHGSADQYPELIEALKPSVALVSVGASNSYGHPTERTLGILKRTGALTLRTDLIGSISLDHANGDLEYSANGVG
ncbi:MAG: ComEC/Rec2 family competence protein [Rhodoluna sp.]